jgi:DNA-binding transcriptional LysR family regulator
MAALSQSTVSARIQTLDGSLRGRLFVRSKAGALMTPAGRRFQRRATILVQTVEHARHIRPPHGVTDSIVIGARIGLWIANDWTGLQQTQTGDELPGTHRIAFAYGTNA